METKKGSHLFSKRAGKNIAKAGISKIGVTPFLAAVFCVLTCFCINEKVFAQRIISLGPSITEQLYLLGAGSELVGCTLYCKHPIDAKEIVATAIEVNVEKVISLKPDIVLATSLIKTKDIIKLKSLGVKIISFNRANSFSKLCSQFLQLAESVDKAEKAKSIVSIANKEVQVIREKVANFKKVSVFVQIGAKPLFTATKESFVNDFIEFAAGTNIAAGSVNGRYAREKVIEQNPEVIIITTMGIAADTEKETWGRYKSLSAVKNERIYIVDSYKVCSPTPLGFAKTLGEIAEILHPEYE